MTSSEGFWAQIFLLTTLIAALAWVSMPDDVPSGATLRYADSVVTKVTQAGRRRAFTFELAGVRQPLRPVPELPRGETHRSLIRPGARVRAGHAGEMAGVPWVSEKLVVYSLEADGRLLYTLDDYRAHAATRRHDGGIMGGAAGGVAAFSFLRWRLLRRQRLHRGRELRVSAAAIPKLGI